MTTDKPDLVKWGEEAQENQRNTVTGEVAVRIQELHGRIALLIARVEALEAALREIADKAEPPICRGVDMNSLFWCNGWNAAGNVARAALDAEADETHETGGEK